MAQNMIIILQLENQREEFKGQFECLGENVEKCITFSIPLTKENDDGKTITYKIKFFDTCRFMQSKL